MPVLAAIDIGANSVRLKIARQERRTLRVLHEDREVLRLGEDVFSRRRLSPEAMARTVKVLRRFKKTVRRFKADAVRVVATSPLREADNPEELVAWVEEATGWRIETASGLEEGRLIHLGVTTHHRYKAERLLLMDLGGGSCELTLSRRGHIEQMYSLPLGAVRLTGDFLAHDPPRANEMERLREAVGGELNRVQNVIRRFGVELMLVTSGTAAALAAAAGDGRAGSRPVSRASVHRLTEALAAESAASRAGRAGIGPRRAEIIVAGAVVFDELLERCELAGFVYSPLGLRDGLLAQMAADRSAASSLSERLHADREESLLAVARHYGVDLNHARRVRAWCDQLFRQLRSVHKLPAEYGELLGAAALLHESGTYINRAGRRRHAQYLIANTEILGFGQEDCRRMAVLARCLGNLRPMPGERSLRTYGPEAALLLPRAIVLLRLACALEQSRHGAVRRLQIGRTAADVRLRLSPQRGGAALEGWALEKERAYFRSVFGLDLTVGLD